MDYLRPATAPTHGDDRVRIAGTSGVVEYTAEVGLTVVTSNGKPRRISELPAGRSLFVDFLGAVYLGTPSGLDWDEIYKVNRIVLAARDAAEQHRLQRI